jgi:hypothetical protein
MIISTHLTLALKASLVSKHFHIYRTLINIPYFAGNTSRGKLGRSSPPPTPPSFTTSGMGDHSNKSASGFLKKFKLFLVLFCILTTFTHGGRITRKIRSLAIRHNFTFSFNNATAAFTPYLQDTPVIFTDGNTFVPEIMKALGVDIQGSSAVLQVKKNQIPAPQLSSGFNVKSDSTSLPPSTKNITIPTLMTRKPVTSLVLALEYLKAFTVLLGLLGVFILIPTLSFVVMVFPAFLETKVLKAQFANQQKVHNINAVLLL